MIIYTHNEYLYSFDGKRLLKIYIDQPSETDSLQVRYLSQFSVKCLEFSRKFLFTYCNNQYLAQYGSGGKEQIYVYRFQISPTFISDEYNSYILKSVFSRRYEVLSQGIKGLIFKNDYIVPSRFFVKGKERRSCEVVLNDEGTPSIVSLVDDQLQIEKIKNNRKTLP